MMREPYRFTKRKSERYIYVTFRHIPGRWFSTGATTMPEAVRYADAVIMRDGLMETGKPETLRQFATGMFDKDDPRGFRRRNEARNRKYSDVYYKQMKGRLDNWILPALGQYTLSSLNPVLIEDWFLGIPKASNTRNKILMCLQYVLDEAMRAHLIESNPARQVTMINPIYRRREPFSKEEMAILFPDDLDSLVRVWGSVMWAGYFCVMKDTGFRPGEVSALRAKNWFPQYRGLYLTESVDCYTRAVKPTIKTSHKGMPYKIGKVTPMTARIIEILKAQSEDGFLFGVPRQGSPHEYRRIIPDTANKHLEGVAKRIGLDLAGRTQYSFRHTFDTDLFGRIPEDVRLQLMGHTSDRAEYLHVTPERGFQILEESLNREG